MNPKVHPDIQIGAEFIKAKRYEDLSYIERLIYDAGFEFGQTVLTGVFAVAVILALAIVGSLYVSAII